MSDRIMMRNAQKRRLSSSSTVESREGVLLELLEDAAVTIQRLKWELESKRDYHRQMLERDEIRVYMGGWQKHSLGDRIATILTNPTAVLSSEHCPFVWGSSCDNNWPIQAAQAAKIDKERRL